MDNDNKIIKKDSEQIHQEVMLFLGDELDTIHKKSSKQTYDIEKEYAKTKKNHSPFAVLVLVGCALVVFGIAFLMNKVISSHNEEIEVSLQAFDDINLKGLLDTVSTAQSNYDTAVKNKIAIEADMESELRNAKESYDNDIFVIDSMNLKIKRIYNEKVAAAKKIYNENVKKIHAEYDEKVSVANKEVQECKSLLAEFDAAKVKAAQESEKALDSERKLRDLEQKKLVDKYEKRITEINNQLITLQSRHSEEIRNSVANVSTQYQQEINALDPKVEDDEADDIISVATSYMTPDFDAEDIIDTNEIESEDLLSVLNEYKDIYDDYKYLAGIINSIPQKNSIPKYKQAADVLVNDLSDLFVEELLNNYDEKQELKGQIESLEKNIEAQQDLIKIQQSNYEATLENVLTLAKTNAILLNAESYDKMSVFVTLKARYLITEDGADAEIKAYKPIKGKIFKAEDDTFYFVVGNEKNDERIEVDFTQMESGLSIKILSK